ncbi:hypothetical protein, conserved [Plasmodium ovale wallikeri]|uniref:Uncharacterized protein n=1 Tax=Plasmodium ovale wallikeri TaxID=864142 RepID=A0A1A8ZL60_PLAOA|nr:hypothetical protein, conserved [Plasmodium ovale wallikeri]
MHLITKHFNYIENSLYNFCKGVSSSENLKYDLKNISNELYLGNRKKEEQSKRSDSETKENTNVRIFNKGNTQLLLLDRSINEGEYHNKKDESTNRDMLLKSDGVNMRSNYYSRDTMSQQDSNNFDYLKKKHNRFGKNEYYENEYGKNSYLDADSDYLKNETCLSCNDIVNSDKTRNSENFNQSPLHRTCISNKTSYGFNMDEKNVDSSAVGGNVIDSSAVGSNAIGGNAIGGNAIGGNAIGGSAIGGNTIGGNTIGGNIAEGRREYDERSYCGSYDLKAHQEFMSKRENLIHLLSNKKIYDNLRDSQKRAKDFSGFSTFTNFKEKNSIFNKIDKYRNFTIKSEDNLAFPSYSYDVNDERVRDSHLQKENILSGNRRIDISRMCNQRSFNSLEKLDILLKNKCKFLNSAGEIDFIFSRKNKNNGDNFKKSFLSCDNYKIDSVMSETFNKNTEMDISDSIVSENMEEINHHQLINRSKRLIEISKKCLSAYSDIDKYDMRDLHFRKDELSKEDANLARSFNSVVHDELRYESYHTDNKKEQSFPPGQDPNEYSYANEEYEEHGFIRKKGGDALLKERGRSYECVKGETAENVEAGRLDNKQSKKKSINKAKKKGSEEEEKKQKQKQKPKQPPQQQQGGVSRIEKTQLMEQNSKSVNKLFEAYDKEKIADINCNADSAPFNEGEIDSKDAEKKKKKKKSSCDDFNSAGLTDGTNCVPIRKISDMKKEGGGKEESCNMEYFDNNGDLNLNVLFEDCPYLRKEGGGSMCARKDLNKLEKMDDMEKKKKKGKNNGKDLSLESTQGDEVSSKLASLKLCENIAGKNNSQDSCEGSDDRSDSVSVSLAKFGNVKKDAYSYEEEKDDVPTNSSYDRNSGGNVPDRGKTEMQNENKSSGGNNSDCSVGHGSARRIAVRQEVAAEYYQKKKEKIPYAEEMKISDGQKKALEQCYDTISHANEVKRLFREKNFLQDLCEKRKVLIQKSKIENTKLNVEIKSLLSFNNNLSYALKEKEAEIKLLKKQKEELEINLMKRLSDNANSQYSFLSNFSTQQNVCRNERIGSNSSSSILSNKNCTMLSNPSDSNNASIIQSYEEKIQELLIQVKMYQTKNNDLQEQLKIFMNQ